MAGNERYATIDDFSGGENTLRPPDQIDKDEAAKLTNLVPGMDGQPLKVRGGATTVMFAGMGPIHGMYRFVRADSSAAPSAFSIVASGAQVVFVNKV